MIRFYEAAAAEGTAGVEAGATGEVGAGAAAEVREIGAGAGAEGGAEGGAALAVAPAVGAEIWAAEAAAARVTHRSSGSLAFSPGQPGRTSACQYHETDAR